MKRLRIEEVRKANTELEGLTNIFVRWGNDLNGGQQVSETLSAFELGKITRSSSNNIGKFSYDIKGIPCDSIHDDFSLSNFLRDLMK